ncbi:MAG: transcription antitermination factor NusB [Firmicutes bacterium]|nr:transcription antitermination factor NusB [Bacillota bacterium]
MSRSKLREKVFQLLFRIAFGSEEEYEEHAVLFFADEEQEALTEKEQKQIQDKYDQILAHLDQIDAQINEKSVGWNVSRLGKVELAIMRLAVYEILFDDTIPGSVSINEAIELAKKYGAQESPAFVNGVLAKFVPKIEKKENS